MVKPPKKIIRLGGVSRRFLTNFNLILFLAFSSLNRNSEKVNEHKFFVHLCQDVILEVLYYGDRRRLTKLERVGRRLFRIIEAQFVEAPFLRLDLRLFPKDRLV